MGVSAETAKRESGSERREGESERGQRAKGESCHSGPEDSANAPSRPILESPMRLVKRA